MDLPEPEHPEALRVIVDNLVGEFRDLDRSIIEEVAGQEYEGLAATSKAPTFVGILAERRARERLAKNP